MPDGQGIVELCQIKLCLGIHLYLGAEAVAEVGQLYHIRDMHRRYLHSHPPFHNFLRSLDFTPTAINPNEYHKNDQHSYHRRKPWYRFRSCERDCQSILT
jgi:hypothetical protein